MSSSRHDEVVGVLAVQRRGERAVQALDDLVRELVADLLHLLDPAHAPLEVVGALKELLEGARAGVRVRGALVEQVGADVVLRDQVEHARCARLGAP
jgi:hypothetical protein